MVPQGRTETQGWKRRDVSGRGRGTRSGVLRDERAERDGAGHLHAVRRAEGLEQGPVSRPCHSELLSGAPLSTCVWQG